ncbi:MAG: NADH-quinone oxidoreductase subunit K, partial [Micromonosporaceae bacterium]|nr:NADH-quinone oxidoreductase subunit K [Micromonosporaceae bacterium]
LMAAELMLNAVNLVLITADAAILRTMQPVLPATGQVFALFVIVLAAAEIGIGLAIILRLYRLRQIVAVDQIPLTEPELVTAAVAGPAPAGGALAATALTATGLDDRP